MNTIIKTAQSLYEGEKILKGIKQSLSTIWMVLFGVLGFMGNALAGVADIVPFSAPKTDPVVKMLASIFGDLGGFGGFSSSTNSTMVGNMFMVFNVCLMTLTGIWLTWLFFKSTLNSAHDGEFLGKKYHSAWVPMRVALGVITIMPLPFLNGWNLAQAFYGLCILVGTGIGNSVASGTVIGGVQIKGAVDYMDITSRKGVDVAAMPNFDWFYDKIASGRANLAEHQNLMIQRLQNDKGLDSSNYAINGIDPMQLDAADGHVTPEFSTRFSEVSKAGNPQTLIFTFGASQDFNVSGYKNYADGIALPLGNDGNLSSDFAGYNNFKGGDAASQAIDVAAIAAMNTFKNDLKIVIAEAMIQYVKDVDRAYASALSMTTANGNCYKDPAISGAIPTGYSYTESCISYGYANMAPGVITGFFKDQANYSDKMKALSLNLAIARKNADVTIKTAILGAKGNGETGLLKNYNSTTLQSNRQMVSKYSWFGLGMILPAASAKSAEIASATTKLAQKKADNYSMEVVTMDANGNPETYTREDPVAKFILESSLGQAIYKALNVVGDGIHTIAGGFGEISEIMKEGGLNKYFIKKIQKNKDGFEGMLTSSSASIGTSSGFSGYSGSGALSKMIALGHNAIGMGSALIDAVLAIVAIFFGIAAIIGLSPLGITAAGTLSLAGSIFPMLGAIVGPIVILLYAAGISLTVVLPFVPMMYWLGVIASILFVYIEAILAAPLWAFAHLDDEGDGMGSQSKRGYVFMFALLFGPAILVISYTVCMQIFELLSGIGSGFISKGALSILQQSNGFLETVGIMIGLISVLFSMHYMLIKLCFGQIVTVMSKVLNMIGGDWGSNVVGEAGGAASDAEHRVSGGMGKAAGMATAVGAAGVGMARMAQASKDRKGAKAQEDKRDAQMALAVSGGGSRGGDGAGSSLPDSGKIRTSDDAPPASMATTNSPAPVAPAPVASTPVASAPGGGGDDFAKIKPKTEKEQADEFSIPTVIRNARKSDGDEIAGSGDMAAKIQEAIDRKIQPLPESAFTITPAKSAGSTPTETAIDNLNNDAGGKSDTPPGDDKP